MPSVTEYRFVYPNSDPAVLTEAQRDALTKIADREGFALTVTVSPIFGGGGGLLGGGGGVIVETDNGLFIGVETDGYAHT